MNCPQFLQFLDERADRLDSALDKVSGTCKGRQ